MNWFIFVAAGNVMGKIYRESDDIDKVFRYIIPITGVVSIVHQYLSITGQAPCFKTLESDWEYYSMATPDALCIAFGVAPFTIGVFHLIGKLIPDKWMSVLGYPARHVNQFFCISWVWIMWIASTLYRVSPATTHFDFLGRWAIVVILTTVTVLIYNKFLKNTLDSYFSRHETAWNIGIWAALVIFGALYFTNVPGPYIMPY